MRPLPRRTSAFLTVLALAFPIAVVTAPAVAHAGGQTAASQASDKAGLKSGKAFTKKVKVVGRGTLVALPPVVQAGPTPAAAPTGAQVVATFEPARPGRVVVFERQTGSGWQSVARRRQDGWGSAALKVRPGTYRALTEDEGGVEILTGRVEARAWTPSFEDTFSGSTLDPTVWNDQRREHESVYAPRTCARTDPAARRVDSGVLHLGVALDPARLDQRCQYTTDEGTGEQSFLLTSQVSTENTRLFRHGIVAARIKPQRAKGMHSGFWLLPEGTKFTDGNPAAGTEIDVMEFFGSKDNGRETIGSFVSYYEPDWQSVQHGGMFREARHALSDDASWWDEFHVFSLEWTPTQYVFRVDGREYHRETNAVSQAQQYLVLSMLASDHELDELTADELGDTADVDWVRVYDATSTTASRSTRSR